MVNPFDMTWRTRGIHVVFYDRVIHFVETMMAFVCSCTPHNHNSMEHGSFVKEILIVMNENRFPSIQGLCLFNINNK